jgi:hypothetical protein
MIPQDMTPERVRGQASAEEPDAAPTPAGWLFIYIFTCHP